MRKILLLTGLLGSFLAHDARSQPFWSVGPKLGYTFGATSGFTGGLEVTYFPQNLTRVYGYTLDVTFWPNHASIHAGVESWAYIGGDIGPTLFISKSKANIGISVIVWDGIFAYPYYELGIPFNGELYHSVGGYLKFPIGLSFDVG